MGVVVLGIISGVLYCCCCWGKRNNSDYSDEENQYSSDDSITNSPDMALKRDDSHKSLFGLLSKDSGGVGGITRNLSKKKLNPNKNNNSPPDNGFNIFPINEFDTRLDSGFLDTNTSNQSFADNHDYSRKILKVANP